MESSNEIGKTEIHENKETISETTINKDKTFNKLKEIQTLLKKESSLNELCKKIIKFKFNYSHSCKRRFN